MAPSISLAACCLVVSALATTACAYAEDATSLLQHQVVVSSRGSSQANEALVPALLPAMHVASAAAMSEPALDVASSAFKNENIAPPKWGGDRLNAVPVDFNLEETEKVSQRVDEEESKKLSLHNIDEEETEKLSHDLDEAEKRIEKEKEAEKLSHKMDEDVNSSHKLYDDEDDNSSFSALSRAADNVIKGMNEEQEKRMRAFADRMRAFANATENITDNVSANSSWWGDSSIYPPGDSPGELLFSTFPLYYKLVNENFWQGWWAFRDNYISNFGHPAVSKNNHYDTEIRDLKTEAAYEEQLGNKKKAGMLSQKACLLNQWLYLTQHPIFHKLEKTCDSYYQCILHPQQVAWWNLKRDNGAHEAYEKWQWRMVHPLTPEPEDEWPTWWTDFLPWNFWNHWVAKWNEKMEQAKTYLKNEEDPPWVQPKTTTPIYPAAPTWCKPFPSPEAWQNGKPGIPDVVLSR